MGGTTSASNTLQRIEELESELNAARENRADMEKTVRTLKASLERGAEMNL